MKSSASEPGLIYLFLANFTFSNEKLNLRNGSEEGKMSNIYGNQMRHGWVGSVVSRVVFRVSLSE